MKPSEPSQSSKVHVEVKIPPNGLDQPSKIKDLDSKTQLHENNCVPNNLIDLPVQPQVFSGSGKWALALSLGFNLVALITKIILFFMSGSVSILASVVDSALDLSSGAIILFTGWRVGKRDPHKFPVGKRRLEPLAVIILATLMGAFSLQVLIEAVFGLINGEYANFSIDSIIGLVIIIVGKGLLYLYCSYVNSKTPSPSVSALATDHLNDCVSNVIAGLFAWAGTNLFPWIDPVGAILISLLVIRNWSNQAKQHISLLTGKAVSKEIVSSLTYVASNHHPSIQMVNRVRGFHFGEHFIAEVSVVLDPEMSLKEAHEIEKSLQIKLEHIIEGCDLAFVHLDVDPHHGPEHKTLA